MRKAFTFLSSLSIIKKSSEEKKASTQASSKTQKANKKSQKSNSKNAKSSQSKSYNTNGTSTKNHNNDNNSLDKIRKNDLNKPAPDLKRLEPITELKRQHLQRKTSNRSANSVTVSTKPNRRRKAFVIIKDSDSESTSEDNEDNDEENEENEKDDDEDDIPLGLRHLRPTSFTKNKSPSSRKNHEYFDKEVRIKNTSSMLLKNNRSMTPDDYPRRLQYSPPAAETPPLISTPCEFLKEPRPRYLEEPRFSSSASSSSSASVDSSGSRYHRDYNASHNRNVTSNNYNQRNTSYSSPYLNVYDGGIRHVPTLSQTERIRRINSIKSNHSRNDHLSRISSKRSDSKLVAGANPPPPNKYQKGNKKMSTNEYHKYQQEMVSAQYLKHGINPVIDESIPDHFEPNLSRMGPTYVQREFMNAPSTRLKKRLSVKDSQVRNTSYTQTGSSESSDYFRTSSESSIQPRINHRYSKHHHTPLHLHSIHSSSSGSGSGGPPTPTSRRSSVMFGSNFSSSRSSTPSS
ncbi:17068_t:CDS:2, partial [Funneliformis geosporum]